MIRKKTKTILSLLKGVIFFTAILCYSQLFAFEYKTDAFAKFSSLPNNKKGLITGYVNNSFIFDSFSFDVNLLFNDDSYIYSLEEKKYLLALRGSSSATYHGDNYLISVGFLDSISSKNFYNKLFLIPTYQFGVKALSRLDINSGRYFTLTNSYVENNTALSAMYLKSFLDESLYVGFSVTPSLKYSLSPNRSISYDKNVSTIDGTVIYYNEYNSLGYGADVSLRKYFNVTDIKDTAHDISMGLSLDYLGFSFKSHFLLGNNNFDLILDESNSYKAFENSLYYTISALTFGGYYLTTDIITSNFKYKTDILELDLQYKFGERFILYSAIFYQDFKLKNKSGLLLGLSFSL